ncbi:DUF2069 domain-containing protein [Paracandidimonas soli]|jgi:uncharacterized membrane protein|uniref:DUF2069 domain-containing protein n=1 Tax=Paracandidimonas soli TaxID=1917182 RepID=UPI003341DB8E
MNSEPVLNPLLYRIASASLVLLIVWCLAWEMAVAPLRPGGSYLALKVLPLMLPLGGVLKGRVYTMQWACMLILLYLMEGVVRAYSDPNPTSALMAWGEIVLSFTFYVCALCYLRPAKLAAKARKKEQERQERERRRAEALEQGS